MKLISPTLLLDKDTCLNNIKRMLDKAKASGLLFRPHFKTHQSAVVADWFRDFGVNTATVSSVRMAAYFAKNNWLDITVAFPFNINETDDVNELAKTAKINLLTESTDTAAFLGKNLRNKTDIYIKIDTGYGRTGVKSADISQISDIINVLNSSDKTHFRGFIVHSGNTYHAESTKIIRQIYQNSISELNKLKNIFENETDRLIVSIGDTPSCSIMEDLSEADEIRPGNFVFYDVMQYLLGSCSFEDIAVCLAVPVVAIHSERNEITVHGGAVHLSKDSVIDNNGVKIYGLPVRLTENAWTKPIENSCVSSLSQEHGTIKCSSELLQKVKVGDFIGILPVHSCLSADLMQEYSLGDGTKIPMMKKSNY